MNKKDYFSYILEKAEKRFGKDSKRLAGDAWKQDWQTVIATIMSAQSRDEVTIVIAEDLFRKYSTLESLAHAKYSDVLKVLKSLNYNKTKAKNVIFCSKMLLDKYGGKVPDTIEALVELPGVGRKTANLVITEVHNKHGICVDTHVHRISNVLGIVKTNTPEQTEFALRELAPKKYWARINRLFVLWGKTVSGRDRKKILNELK